MAVEELQYGGRSTPAIRYITHFACTGGTLISRAIQAQPSVTLLSELDPLSDLPLRTRSSLFAPTDLIHSCRTSVHGMGDDVCAEIFLAGLNVVASHSENIGRSLVIRGHAHSQYCVTPQRSRPTLYNILLQKFEVSGIITVRHPLDSWLALIAHDWRHFEPFTLDEYCSRYMSFLEDHEGLDRLKYESFVSDPDAAMVWVCRKLNLRENPRWRDLLAGVRLSGDSGRTGNRISGRERRPMPDDVLGAVDASAAYRRLCERLGYEPQP